MRSCGTKDGARSQPPPPAPRPLPLTPPPIPESIPILPIPHSIMSFLDTALTTEDYQKLGGVGGAIAVLLVLILFFRVHAFIALLISSICVGLFTGMELPLIAQSVQDGMASSLGFIAAVIGLGAIFGEILEASGGAESVARTLLKGTGEKRASWAMMLAGFLISIPVFLDVGLVILIPIVYTLTRDTKKSLLYYGIPLLAGMAVTHACVPPTPGPIAVSNYLSDAINITAPLGLIALYGCIVGLPTAIVAGPLFGSWIAKRIHLDIPKWAREELANAPKNPAKLPPFLLVFAIILLPLLLMLAGALTDTWVKGQEKAALAIDATLLQTLDVVRFIGHPIIALLLTTVLTWITLGLMRGFSGKHLMDLSSKALGPAGLIILITGAGGVFKQMLGASGTAQTLARSLLGESSTHFAILVAAYLLTAVVRLIQGSATVAMVTGGALIASVLATLPDTVTTTPSDVALLTLSIAFGATLFSHVNDSGFWLVSRYFGMTEKQTFASWSVMETIISVVGFLLVLLLSLVV